MRVNVIVPCHNGARFLGEALKSALQQTHSDTTVLVVDDGSTDETGRIARGFGDRVSVIRQPKSGVSAARNRAIDATDGEYVAFLDADDRWHPDKLSRQLALMSDHPQYGLVHTAIRHIDAASRVIGRPDNALCRRNTQGDCVARLLSRNTIATSSVLLRRDLLRGERFRTDMAAAEDWDLWLRLASRTRFGCVDEELTDYRFHDSNTVRRRELMLTGELTVMERALARVTNPAHRALAIRGRRAALAALGNLAYELNDLRRARRFLWQAGMPLGSEGLVTFAAVFLPDAVRQPARVGWRLLRRVLFASSRAIGGPSEPIPPPASF
jgi:glycosyltransferase involved in cell wall biosynthesis